VDLLMNGKISELPSNHTYDPSRNIQQQRRYSTLRKVKLNPSFVSGLTDGEGCFTLSLTRDNKYNTGWRVKPVFSLGVHKKDRALLE